jgi:hypothetical protein
MKHTVAWKACKISLPSTSETILGVFLRDKKYVGGKVINYKVRYKW